MQVKGDRIVVKELENTTTQTKSGLIMVDVAEKDDGLYGEVIAIGTGKKVQEFGLKVGDIIVSHQMYAGTPIIYKGKSYKVMDVEYVFYTTDEEFKELSPEEKMAIEAGKIEGKGETPVHKESRVWTPRDKAMKEFTDNKGKRKK